MNDDKRRQRATETLDAYLKLHNMRRTPERYAILDKVVGMKRPFAAESLRDVLASGGYPVSLTTVYNALSLFSAAGLLRKAHMDGRADMWEMTDTSAGGMLRIRLVCTRCGKTRSLRDNELARQLSLRRFASFSASLFDLCVSGTCTRCRSAANTRNRKKN